MNSAEEAEPTIYAYETTLPLFTSQTCIHCTTFMQESGLLPMTQDLWSLNFLKEWQSYEGCLQ